MKKMILAMLTLGLSVSTFANTTGVHEDGYTSFTSPRTGVVYSLSNPSQQEIVFKAQELKAVTAETAQRIIATNPALSPESQEQARQKLVPNTQPEPTVVAVNQE